MNIRDIIDKRSVEAEELIKKTRWALYISFAISLIFHLIPVATKFEIPKKEIEIRRNLYSPPPD
ncbi:MAG: hypothetical protein ACE5QV_06975 [Fidelibacterota bacterium]